MTRRPLVASVALAAALVGGAALLVACGDDGPSDGDAGATTTTAPLPYGLEQVAVLDRPSTATEAPDGRLYVGEQDGRVLLVDPATGDVEEVLDRTDETGDPLEFVEAGLLGLAVSPDGSRLYVSDAVPTPDPDDDERAVVRRVEWYQLDADGRPDPATRTSVLELVKEKPVHNGGQVAFGPDGHLYTSIGDGWPFNDANRTGQDPSDWFGGLLRIDPDPAGGGYTVPADNPFADGGGAPEVWTYGLRNPWRFTWDPETGDLWIADVGQELWEEIDRVAAADAAGANFGWSVLEGTHPFTPSEVAEQLEQQEEEVTGTTAPPSTAAPSTAPGDTSDFVPPVWEYSHDEGCAVIGGVLYRGEAFPDLDGGYLYSDFCDTTLRVLREGADGTWAPEPVAAVDGAVLSVGPQVGDDVYVLAVGGLYRLRG